MGATVHTGKNTSGYTTGGFWGEDEGSGEDEGGRR